MKRDAARDGGRTGAEGRHGDVEGWRLRKGEEAVEVEVGEAAFRLTGRELVASGAWYKKT